MLDLTGKTLQGKYQVVLRSPEQVIGGTILGPVGWDDNTPWSDWHDIDAAITVLAPGCDIIDTDVIDAGDGVAIGSRKNSAGVEIGGDNLHLRRISVLRAHDDALEDDQMRSFTVEQSRFEGMDFLSTISPNGSRDGTGSLIVINDTIARLRPYYQSFKPEKYGFNLHGGVFKTPRPEQVGLGTGKQGIPPQIILKNCMFFASKIPRYGSLGCPPNVTGDTITLCWEGPDGAWPPAAVAEWQKQCTNVQVTTNPRLWELYSAIWDYVYRP